MRVAQVTLRFDAPGGVETTVRELSKGLRAAGDEVEVFASDLVDESAWERASAFRGEVDGVPVRRFPVRRQIVPGVTMPTLLGLEEALAKSRPDVIHAHSHRYGHVLQSARAARRLGVPLVVSTHYHPADPWEPRWKRAVLRIEDQLFGWGAYRSAGALIVESRREADAIRRFSRPGLAREVPPGIDLGEWADAEHDRADGLALPSGYVLFVGRIASNKGLPVLFEALARLPPAQRPPLVLMGPDWGESPGLRALADRLGIGERVRWLGNVPGRAAYRAVVRGARVLVLPSAWEAYGLVLLDAMVAHVPIVATSVGAVPEVLEAGAAGRLVPYDDPEALAGALRAVADDPAGTAARLARAEQLVRQRDWATSVARVRDVYRALVG